MIDYIEVDNRIKVRNPQDLLHCDIVVNVNKFCESAFHQFKDDFNLAHETGQSIIPIVIDSFGGEAHSLLAMADLIAASDRTIATVVMGKAMSCGAILATCGAEGYRFASPKSTIMIHDVSSDAFGKTEEIRSFAENVQGLNKLLFEMMDKNCGLEKGTLLGKLRNEQHSAEWFLTPYQAKKLNIINHVRVPKLVTKVSVVSELL